MNRIIAALLIFICLSPGYAQVEMGKTKNTVMGKGKLLGQMPNELLIDNFGIDINLYAYGEDQGGGLGSTSVATVGVRAHLTEVDEPLSQEIANKAWEYFVSSWADRGVTIRIPSVEEIESAKKFSKAKSKGKNATITNGGVWDNAQKKKHNMMSWPEGVNIASSGSGPVPAVGNVANLYTPSEIVKINFGNTTFGSSINFITFKTAKIGSTASVKPLPELTAVNSLSAGNWVKGKMGAYAGSNKSTGIEDFYKELDKSGFEFLGSSSNDWNYIADKEKFKANVMEMITKGMDDLFADYDVAVADNS